MKSKWNKVSLRHLISFISKGIAPVYAESETKTTIRVLNQKCNRNFQIRYSDSRLHDESKKRVPTDKYIKKYDILINSTGRGTAGRIAQINNVPCKTIVDGHMIIIRANDQVTQRYLGYALKAHQQKVLQLDEGSTGQTELDRERLLEEIIISYPESLDIQKKIVALLERIDEKIELNNKINDNLQQQAFALFEQLLINAGDVECSVADIAHLNPKRALAKNQEAKCIEMSQLSTSGAFPSGWEKRLFTGGMRFSNGDTLLARITPCLENGKAAFIDFLDTLEVAFGSTEYIVLASKGEVPPEFLYCLARYPAFSDYAVKNMNGSSGRQRVSAETIGQFKLPRPSTNELKRFGNAVSSLFLKMRFNSLENICLSSLRDSLLPKLISGELDVSELDI